MRRERFRVFTGRSVYTRTHGMRLVTGSSVPSGTTYKIITGCMFAGKSSELLRRVRRMRRRGWKVLLATSALDSRSTHTHDGVHAEEEFHVLRAASATQIAEAALLQRAKLCAIDEAQMFGDDFEDAVSRMLRAGTSVIAAGLDTKWDGTPFGAWVHTHPEADKRKHLRAVCGRCMRNNAVFTDVRTAESTGAMSGSDIHVGGEERYVAVCRTCHGVRD